MFIIKYMAGIVDRAVEESRTQSRMFFDSNADSSYDPHAHRMVKHPTSYMDTMIHLLKGSIGAGILAMPEATKKMGIIGAIVGLIVVGLFAAACIQILIAAQYKLCKRFKTGYLDYATSLRLALRDGPNCLKFLKDAAYYFVDSVLIFWQLGICCIYFVFVAENIKQVTDHYNFVFPLRLHLCYILLPQILSCILKNLKLMTPISSLSMGLTMLGLILVFYYLIEDDLEFHKSQLQLKSIEEIPFFVGTCLFALEAVGVVLALEYNMEDPKRFVGMFGLFNLGMVMIMALYLSVGVFGYLKYGDEILSSITLNLPKNQKKAQVAKIIFAVAIFFTFPLQNFVAYNIIWKKLQPKISPNRQCIVDYALRIILVIVPWLMAVAVPKLGTIISVIGAFSLSNLAMVFPGVMNIAIYYTEPEGYGNFRIRLWRDIVIVIIGLGIMVLGVYSGILDVIKSGSDD